VVARALIALVDPVGLFGFSLRVYEV